MRLITDRSPASFTGSALPWRPLAREAADDSALREVFGPAAALHTAEIPGDGFPLVLWRGEAAESQLDLLRRLDPATLPPRLVLVAESGPAFHGHFDRGWAAEPGNLHLACFIREPLPLATVGMGHAILPSLALADAAAEIIGNEASVQIKWMNDVLVDGAKVGGTLAVTTTKGAMVETAILGMGLNLAHTPEVPSDPFVPRVGNLSDHVDAPDPLDALRTVLKHLDRWLATLRRDGAAPLAARHRVLSAVIGERVCLFDDGPGFDDRRIGDRPLLARGMVEEIGDHLQLRIDGRWFARGRLAFEADLSEGRAPSG